MADQPRGAGDGKTETAAGGQNATWALLIFLAVSAVLVYLLGYGR
jgi:hypothetical protein